MLYLSTRNKTESYTAYRVLRSERAVCDGMFMPMHLPVMDDIALASFERMNTGEAIASIMNLFFDTNISAWDVDFAVGRQAVELVSFGYKVSLAESWHNPAGSYDYFVNCLYSLAIGEKQTKRIPNAWFQTAVHIALLFAVYGKYCRQDIYTFDIAVDADDMQLLLAIRYAQKMGLPVRKIILGTSEVNGLWELFSYGVYQTNRKRIVPGFDALLWLEFGYREAQNYLQCIQDKVIYRVKDTRVDALHNSGFSAVVGDNRVGNIVENMLSTNNYTMEKETARAFGALQDYRAKTGENRNTLLFAKNNPNF